MKRSEAMIVFVITMLAACTQVVGEVGDRADHHDTDFKHMATQPWTGGSTARQPGDSEAVMAKEFRASEAEGTREGLIRFIARHPDHPLADKARALLDSRPDLPVSRPGSKDPDADIYAGFDRARKLNTPDAYDAFIRRYGPHPLTLEAQKLRDERR